MYDLVATCPDEIKDVLAEEIRTLGGTNISFDYRAVNFQVDDAGFFDAHLSLRTASRLFMVLKQVPAKREIILRSQAYRFHWEDYMTADSTFMIDGVQTDRGNMFMSSNSLSKAVREGLQERFKNKFGKIPLVDLKEPDVKIIAYCKKERVTLSIDTSGKALHKRGYRMGGHPAPLKETLAAGILKVAGYDGSMPIYDPMCGSGTLVIEAAMMSLQKAPMIHRKKGEFGFEALRSVDRALFRKEQEKHRQEKLTEPAKPLFASDIDEGYLNHARSNALRARVEKHINFFQKDFLKSSPPGNEPGLMVFNMPYGERLAKDDEMKEFIQEIGRKLKFDYPGWRAAVLAAKESPYKLLGLRPDKKVDLLNGSIPVKLLIFDLYKGKRT